MNAKRSNRSLTLQIAVFIFIILGCIVTAWGLSHLSWPGALTFSKGGAGQCSIFVLTCFLLIATVSHWSRLNPIAIGCFVSGGLSMLAGAVWPLIVTLCFVFSSAILGKAILFAFHNGNKTINWATNFLVGVGVYGTIMGLLAQFPVNYPGVYAVSLAAPLIFWWRQSLQLIHTAWACINNRCPSEPRNDLIDISIVTVSLVYIVVALMPEVGFDALATHLFIPAQLASKHQWGFDVSTYVWAVMPFLGDCIFSIGYMLAGETAARLINVVFIFVLCWIIRELVIWSGGKDRGARWAVFIFLSTPLTFTEGSSLFIDAVWASFLADGVLTVLRICSDSLNGDKKVGIGVSGILLGCALATKMPALAVFPALLFLLIYHYKAWLRSELYRVLSFGFFVFLLLGFIPYIRSYLITGNPVFPFFNQVFKSPYYPPINFNNPIYNSGLSWDTIYRVTFDSGHYLESTPGASGFQWLVLLIPAIILLLLNRRWKSMKIAGIAVLAIAITFHSQSYLRYVFPSFVLLSAVLGVFLSELFCSSIIEGKLVCIIACLIVGLNLLFLNAGALYPDFPLKSLVSESHREAYLQSRLPIRNAVELVNHLNTKRTPVAVFAHPMAAGLEVDALYPNWYNYLFQDQISKADSEVAIADVLANKNIDFVLLADYWGTAEQRLRIKNVTEQISQMGSISVRSLRKELIYKTELLKNPDFKSSDGWVLSEGAVITPGIGAIVSVASNISQVVPVTPGRLYVNTVKVRCADKITQGRIQINWLDASSHFVKTDIRVFNCSICPTGHKMEVICPPEANYAIVYCSGHTSVPLVYESNSLKQ